MSKMRISNNRRKIKQSIERPHQVYPKFLTDAWLVIFGVVGAIIIVIVAIIFYTIRSQYSATLDIRLAPTFATARINGRNYGSGEHKMRPGENIEVEILAKGFTTQTKTISLHADQTTTLYLFLVPEDGDMNWYSQDNREFDNMETIGSLVARQEATEYLAENPIVEILPYIYADFNANAGYDYTEYRIDGGEFEDCESDFCLQIEDATGGNYENALNYLRSQGYNPDNYEILYKYTPIEPLAE